MAPPIVNRTSLLMTAAVLVMAIPGAAAGNEEPIDCTQASDDPEVVAACQKAYEVVLEEAPGLLLSKYYVDTSISGTYVLECLYAKSRDFSTVVEQRFLRVRAGYEDDNGNEHDYVDQEAIYVYAYTAPGNVCEW